MIGPNYKQVSLHRDALKVFKNEVEPYPQLRSIYDGLTWLIANNHKNGTNLYNGYYLIKSSEKIPTWHKNTLPMDKLPTITILYSVEAKSIMVEGINLRAGEG